MNGVDLSSIVDGAFDAAMRDELWEDWARDLFDKFGGSGGLFGLHNTQDQSLTRIITMSAPARSIDEYKSGYYEFDPQIPLVSNLPGSTVYRDIPNAGDSGREVDDYLKWQHDVAQMRYSQTAVMELEGTPFRASICVHRTRELGPVTNEQHQALCRLVPQLERIFSLAFRHSDLLASTYWDGIMVGRRDEIAFLIDERGKVMRHTDAADALLRQRDGIDIRAGRLSALRDAETSVLQSIVARAIDKTAPASGSTPIVRRSGKRPLIVICHPLPRRSRMIAPLEAAALVTVIDRHTHRQGSPDIYRQAFGLTARETDMANAILRGHSVESAASMLGIALPTARTHLSRLLDKTETSGQVSLIQLLMSLV